jgi:hypothetical protein
MRRRSRTRQVLKWIGTVLCVLLAIAWVISGWYHVQFNGPHGTWVYRAACVRGTLVVWDAHDTARDVRQARQALAELRNMGMHDAALEGERILGPVIRTLVVDPVPARRMSERFVWWPQAQVSAVRAVRIPLWSLLLGVCAPTIILWWLDRRRIPPGHCHKCGYNLTGNVSGRCPECGEPVRLESETLTPDARAKNAEGQE